ncbi:DUF393 domain-containing protein [Ruegeria sp. 2205SS24-7]|uniref:thiol-disulfide oxidoreductase DCC family protein n=1 Tax=Ruegeria discodermiae TaxID=3064389 RepID=UPI0027423D5D|nr:DUF393 domain-containing protein [Ruegeria sp. 2205SS24-7]MDP5219284.1 DUF393 domain-containing protein [Ruegeria sp. 2205SS24-7]
MNTTHTTRVLFNAQCPVCNYEIRHYERYAKRHALPLRFEDLNTEDLAQWGLTRDQAARRLYVLKDGALYGGIDGFLVLWQDMRRYRWLARIVGLPGIRWLASALYDHALAPLIYRWHLARLRKQKLRA